MCGSLFSYKTFLGQSRNLCSWTFSLASPFPHNKYNKYRLFPTLTSAPWYSPLSYFTSTPNGLHLISRRYASCTPVQPTHRHPHQPTRTLEPDDPAADEAKPTSAEEERENERAAALIKEHTQLVHVHSTWWLHLITQDCAMWSQGEESALEAFNVCMMSVCLYI